jgi:hypothetical protein
MKRAGGPSELLLPSACAVGSRSSRVVRCAPARPDRPLAGVLHA